MNTISLKAKKEYFDLSDVLQCMNAIPVKALHFHLIKARVYQAVSEDNIEISYYISHVLRCLCMKLLQNAIRVAAKSKATDYVIRMFDMCMAAKNLPGLAPLAFRDLDKQIKLIDAGKYVKCNGITFITLHGAFKSDIPFIAWKKDNICAKYEKKPKLFSWIFESGYLRLNDVINVRMSCRLFYEQSFVAFEKTYMDYILNEWLNEPILRILSSMQPCFCNQFELHKMTLDMTRNVLNSALIDIICGLSNKKEQKNESFLKFAAKVIAGLSKDWNINDDVLKRFENTLCS